MHAELEALSIAHFHDAKLASPGWPQDASGGASAWHWIHANHRCNTLLWHEDVRMRSPAIAPPELAASQRLVSVLEEQRADAIEGIDEAILDQLATVAHGASARLSSESAGQMIDRMSVLSLELWHMRLQTLRTDAGAEHVHACTRKLRRLMIQRGDLTGCLDQLLAEARSGRAYFKIYLRFKIDDGAVHAATQGARHAS